MVEFEDELEEEFDEEFDDEFEEDWEEFEPEPEEFFTGPLYIPTESSVNFELYSLFGSIVAMLLASFMLYTKVLVGVYDSGFGGGTFDEKVANYDYQQAQGKVEIIGFGKYIPESKADAYDYAVLDAGSNHGISPGMIYYFQPANGQGPRNGYWTVDENNPDSKPQMQFKPEDLTMLVVREVGEDYARAEFARYITEDDKKQYKNVTGKDLENTLHDYVVLNQPSFNEYTNVKSPATFATPFPYKSKVCKPFQYYIWEEAFDVSGEDNYKAISLDSIDRDFNVVKSAIQEDYADPNSKWNVMKRVMLSLDDIKKLLEIEDEKAINKESSVITDENRIALENAMILFNQAQFAFLAPPVDQTLFNVVINKLED